MQGKEVVVTEKGTHVLNGVHLCNGRKPNMTAETIVKIHPESQKGCYFTRFQVVSCAVAFLLTITVAIVLVAFVKKEPNIYVTRTSGLMSCDKHGGYNVTVALMKEMKNDTMVFSDNLTQVENVTGAGESGKNVSKLSSDEPGDEIKEVSPVYNVPYRDIRLPRSLIPIHYDINLMIDLENTTFHGRVNMTLDAKESTNYVIFHFFMLRIFRPSIRVRNQKSEENIQIKRQFRVFANQFYVLQLSSDLVSGETYQVDVSFSGRINKDLKGLYLSTYETPAGETR